MERVPLRSKHGAELEIGELASAINAEKPTGYVPVTSLFTVHCHLPASLRLRHGRRQNPRHPGAAGIHDPFGMLGPPA
ncbi:MAG: hypothetical protein AMXMBFR7_13880 [Planctomycetota bacterium]